LIVALVRIPIPLHAVSGLAKQGLYPSVFFLR
jgi:hypothetical protein